MVIALSLSAGVSPALYAATDVGVFRSDDGGSAWVEAGLFGTALSSLASDPFESSLCYAATAFSGTLRYPVAGGIWKTSDGGATWQQTPAANAPLLSSFSSVALDPSSAANVYAGGAGVLKSTDAGATWQPSNDGLPVNPPLDPFPPDVIQIVWHPTDPNAGYLIAFAGRGVFKTTNAGGNWKEVSPADVAPIQSVDRLAISPTSPSVLFATSSQYPTLGEVFRSDDAGASWSKMSTLPTGITALAVDPFSPWTVFVGTSDRGVLVSGDGGATWESFNDGLGNLNVHVLAAFSASPQTLFAGTDDGVYEITRSLQALPARPPVRVVTR
jgi:photosystem II stability/assembly factor-like uncharacterized protein